MTAQELAKKLVLPLDKDLIKKREGAGGKEFSYLEGHQAFRIANELFGWDGWSYSVDFCEPVSGIPDEYESYGKTKYRVGYRAKVTVSVTTESSIVKRSDVGFGNGSDSNPVDCHELAMKEAVTDALKRALKGFGAAFGLDLYDKDYLALLEKGKAGYNEKNGSTYAPEPSVLPPDASDLMVKQEWERIGKDAGMTPDDRRAEIARLVEVDIEKPKAVRHVCQIVAVHPRPTAEQVREWVNLLIAKQQNGEL